MSHNHILDRIAMRPVWPSGKHLMRPISSLMVFADGSGSSSIVLHASQTRYLNALLYSVHNNEPLMSTYITSRLTLAHSRRMAWDMVKAAIHKVRSEDDILSLSFAGLCCVLRAGLVVLDTAELVEKDEVKDIELDGFRRLLMWFSNNWSIGEVYLAQLDTLR